MESEPYLAPGTKINSKRIACVNVRPEIFKYLGENKGGDLRDIGLDNDFLNKMPKHRQEQQLWTRGARGTRASWRAPALPRRQPTR